jgi:hypothetical protein
MTTLLAPPSPARLPSVRPTVSFLGRTFEEYTRCFALDPAALRRTAVLDVAAGPSSFTAEAVRRGIDAVAVDPLYDRPAAQLAVQVRADHHRMFAPARPQLFRRKSGPSFAAVEADRRLAAARFLADYDNNLRHGRYVRAALPQLPFLDQGFSLVLCAHLLFRSAARFDYAWHLAACRELVRVSAGEARIHPVGGPGGRPYAELGRLCTDLAADGVRAELVPVGHQGSTGRGRMLVLRRDRSLRRPATA